MTFEEWLEKKLTRATENAEESWMIAPSSYGTGWDKGYEAALQEIFSAIPASIAFAHFPQGDRTSSVMSERELDKHEYAAAQLSRIKESFRAAREVKDWGPEERPRPNLPVILDNALQTLQHARIFITSREKMHPNGVVLYDETIELIKAARAAFPSSTECEP